jgi:hypothetical protein
MSAPSRRDPEPRRSSGIPRHVAALLAAWVAAVLLSPPPARDLVLAVGLLGAYYAAVARWLLPVDVRFGGQRHLMYRLLVELVVPAALAAGLMFAVASDPLRELPVLERAARLVRAGLLERAETELRDWLERHPEDVRAHRVRLWAHFRAPLTRSRNHHRSGSRRGRTSPTTPGSARRRSSPARSRASRSMCASPRSSG